MFPADVAERFGREMGLTLADWQRSLPGAVGDHALERPGEAQATVRLHGGGHLHIGWQALPARSLGLARLPRMQVDFAFFDVDPARRREFMRRFDLYMQRGGG